jgi:transcription elongation factor GreA
MSDVTWLTQEAYEKLQAELADREGPHRREISEKIGRARDEGDLKENAGYHAAREEQGINEARITQIKAILKDAQIGTPDAHPNEVAQGKVITVHFEAFGEEETFLLASREEAAHASIDVYSPSSPLGSAILGKHIGDSATYVMPNGKEMAVRITKVEPYTS